MHSVVKAFPNDVSVYIKQFPLGFHNNAMNAAKAAMAAERQGKFWEMTDVMYKNFRALDEPKLEEYAKQAGMNVAKFKKDYADPAVAKAVQDHMAEARTVGVRGTPSFFINGKVMPPEGRSPEGLKALVAKLIKG